MENETNDNFTLGKDDSDDDYKAEASSRQIARLSQKLTLLTILIPCLLIVVIVFIYLDITNKVGKVDSTGTAQFKSISKEIDKKLSNMKTSSQELEKKLNTRIADIEKSLSAVSKTATKADKNIGWLINSKSNKKATKAEFKKVKTETTALTKDIELLMTQSKNILLIAETLKEKINEIAIIKASMEELKTDTDTKLSQCVNKTDVDNTLKKQQRLLRLELDQHFNKIDKKIALMKYSTQKDPSGTSVVEEDLNKH